MSKNKIPKLLPVAFAVLLIGFFILLFFIDNKYQCPPPYGKDGVISINENDLKQNKPLFLIDGWLLTDEHSENLPTYIGEFSNLQRGNKNVSPHGNAIYKMTLHYTGEPMEVAINFPQLFSRYVITLNGKILSQGTGNSQSSFTITEGDHLMEVRTLSKVGYYSGMYHPPSLGLTRTIFYTSIIQCIAYSIACFAVLSLTIFTLALWHQAKDKLSLWFGLLCSCFSLYVSYYFMNLLSITLGEYWFLIQSMALYGMCFCVLRLTALAGGLEKQKFSHYLHNILLVCSILLLILAVLSPVLTWSVWLHGIVTNLYYIFTFCSVLFLLLRSNHDTTREHKLTLLSCIAFASGLLYNLFASNNFEPIFFFWQFEWCGLIFVILFGAMMASRNKRILAENLAFQIHLEDLVKQRTEELENLMQERKIFFADMAHDLKAPVFAAGSFIQAIRAHNTGVDGELLRYIDLVEQKQQEMMRRVQGLTIFNQIDELSEPYMSVSVTDLLKQVYHAHYMAAEVQSVYLIVDFPDIDANLYAQQKKLDILFENLIINALKFTPRDGKITISATIDDEGCHLSVSDTGHGISAEEVPHIFERFYIGEKGKGSGSGLGLYIAKSIVDELNGEIYVSSKLGSGSTFFIDLPIKKA